MTEREFPSQDYYPAAKVRLNIRFEEFADKTKAVSAKAPRLPPQLIRGQKGFRAPLEVKDDPASPPGFKRFLLVPKSGQAPNQISPQKQTKSQDLRTHLIGGIIPKTAVLGKNGIRTADTLTVTIRYLDMPIDPRTVRSCGIQFYLGTLTEKEAQLGFQGVTRGGYFGDNTPNAADPLNVVPDTYLDEHGQTRSNLRFEGFVDKWEVDWPENGEPVVILECRDNTTLLIDQLAPPRLMINPKKPIDRAIAEYLANFPRFSGLSVEYRPGGVAIPTLATALAKTAYRPSTGPSPNGDQQVWDYLTDIMGTLGHTIRVEGTLIILQRVVTVTSSKFVESVRPDDPYRPRKLATGRNLDIRHFIYGRNILSMKVARSYTVLQNVEVRCYSPKRKKTLVARFPKVGDQVFNTIVRPGDIADQKWTVFRYSGVEDEKTLRVVAQGIYESVNRTEMTVNIKTRNLSSFGGGNLDPDILDLLAGDSVEIQINRDEKEFNSLTAIESILLMQNRTQEYLTHLGYEGAFAKAYAESYSNIGFQTTFRVRAVTVNWDMDNGVELDVLCVNYLEVRGEKIQLPPGEEITPAQTAGNKPTSVKQKPLLPTTTRVIMALPLDVQTIRDLLKGPGLDTRQWVSYATVAKPDGEDTTIVEFTEEYGPLVNITLQPSGIDTRARVAGFIAGIGEGSYYPFQSGDELIVLIPEGNERNCVIIGRLNQEIDKFPTTVAGNPVDSNTFGFWRLITPFVIETRNQFTIINPTHSAAFIMEAGGNVTLRDGLLSFLHLGADFLGMQTNDGTLLMQMNLASNKIRLAHNNDPGKPSAIFDINGQSSGFYTGGTLALATAGNPAEFHAVTFESVVALIAANNAAIAAAIVALGGPAAYLAPVWSNPGPVSAIPGASTVELALPVAAVTPVNAVAQQLFNQYLGIPKTIGVPGVGCVGLTMG